MSDYARYTAVALSQALISRIDPVQFSLIQIWLAILKMSKTQVKACRLGASRVAVKSFGAQVLIRDFSLNRNEPAKCSNPFCIWYSRDKGVKD